MSAGFSILTLAWQIGTALVLLLAPTQWSLHLRERAYISIVDPLLVVTALLWGLDVLRRNRWRDIPLPPIEQCLFLLLAAVSLSVASDRAEALKNIAQFWFYFGVLHVLVRDTLRQNPRALRIGLNLVFIGPAVNLLLALAQYYNTQLDSFDIRGAFGNRNVLGGYLALLVPLCVGIVLYDTHPMQRIIAGILLPAAALVMLSGAAFLAVTMSIGIGLLCVRRRLAFAVLVVLVILLVDGVYPRLQRGNDQELLDSIALYDGMAKATYRYPEWQAATIMILENPWRGVGGGNYQRNINRYYGVIPNPTGPQEPDIQNLYLVIGGTLGLPGLAAFLAMLVLAIGGAGMHWRESNTSAARSLAFGGACALGAFAIAAIFSPLLVRGIVPLLGALLAAQHGLRCGDSATSGAVSDARSVLAT